MKLLHFIGHCSRGRAAWLLLVVSALFLELLALYFQHVQLLQPCVLCIYQRVALFGILIAGLLGSVSPKHQLIRYIAILAWMYSAWQGLKLAWVHTMTQLHPSALTTCDFFVSFPSWLPLDKWLPSVFYASGDCSVKQWSFLTLEMSQWLIGIFAFYLLISILVAISQLFGSPQRSLFNR